MEGLGTGVMGDLDFRGLPPKVGVKVPDSRTLTFSIARLARLPFCFHSAGDLLGGMGKAEGVGVMELSYDSVV